MLTVRFDELGLRPGDLLLDMGCGPGRHALESFRHGARVVALDRALAELGDLAGMFAAMRDAGEAAVAPAPLAAVANADAGRLPFADGAFHRVIASEVLEHVADDEAAMAELARVLAPGGTLAVTVPAWLPERLCWALSDEYHAPFVPGGHLRIYTRRALVGLIRATGLEPIGSHRKHALHSPYWWLRCAVGPSREDHLLVRCYRQLLVWDITGAVAVSSLTRLAERVLDPVLGKSVVVYARKPGGDGSGTRARPGR